MQTVMYDVLYYVYVLFFGVYISMGIACGSIAVREWKAISFLSLELLIAQGLVLQLWGMDGVWKLYPVIVHLPMALAMIFLLKIKWDMALVSVLIAYALCQPLRWLGLMLDALDIFPAASLVLHLCLCQLFLVLFSKYCIQAIHRVLDRSTHLRICFGALPALYYLYEYMMMYTQNRFAQFLPFHELLPTVMILFFILFSMICQREIEKREAYERQAIMLEAELSQAANEIKLLRVVEEKTAIHRHDLRHHLQMIDHLLSTDKAAQASAYIRETIGKTESIAPVRYCENELVNLLISDFQKKAETAGISMHVKAALPCELSLSDTELCALLSNGLENAIHAVSGLPMPAEKRIDLLIDIRQKHLLIEIKNPYAGEITMKNGLPLAQNGEARYGCRSMQSIALNRNGDCLFDAANGSFILRIAIPLAMTP